MNESLKEKIKYYTEWVRMLAVALLADVTGTLSLFRVDTPSKIDYFLEFLGILTTFVIAAFIALFNKKINAKLKNLSK